jgi:HlyD family secretion protein
MGIMMRKNIFSVVIAALALVSCGNKDGEYAATGTFEATEVTVSAEQNGVLLDFNIEEGDTVGADRQVALIDTVQLYLKACQVGAVKQVYAAQRPDMTKQVAATRQQLAKARQEQERFASLVKAGAANRKALDDAESQVKVLERQLEAQLSSLHTSTDGLQAQMNTADIERLQVADQLRKCHVKTPISGTILAKYMQQGEFAVAGKPLFKMADTRNMFLRAYLTSAQLKDIRLGQSMTVYADYGNGERKEYAGKVTWISSKSEFTPKTILTDDERADLVYAVKIAVRNDGYLKIGMYGGVKHDNGK